jgi:hypothetical protein
MKRGPSPVLGASPYAKAVTRLVHYSAKVRFRLGSNSRPFHHDRDSDSDSAPVKRVGKCDRIRFTGADKTSNRFSCQAGITCTPPFFKSVRGACRVCREGYEWMRISNSTAQSCGAKSIAGRALSTAAATFCKCDFLAPTRDRSHSLAPRAPPLQPGGLFS